MKCGVKNCFLIEMRILQEEHWIDELILLLVAKNRFENEHLYIQGD
jgi:hypothetical protein